MIVKEAAPAAPRRAPAPYESPWMNDELRMFRKTAARFIREEFLPCEPRWREQHRPDADAWTKAGQTGVLLTDVPEEYGGGGGTFAHEAVMFEEMAYAGDDLTDVVVMRRVGLAIAVANAREEVKQAAHHVTSARGGSGAVREICELLLEAHGKWQAILEKYEVTRGAAPRPPAPE